MYNQLLLSKQLAWKQLTLVSRRCRFIYLKATLATNRFERVPEMLRGEANVSHGGSPRYFSRGRRWHIPGSIG